MQQIKQKVMSFISHVKNLFNRSKTENTNKKLLLSLMLGVIVVAAGYLFYRNLGIFVVAKVNNSYITRLTLLSELSKRYGAQTLEDLIVLETIKSQLTKENVATTEQEITDRITQIEGSLNGAKLADLLQAQNITLVDFKKQLVLQLGVEKFVSKGINVTDEEIDLFIKDNGAQLVSLVEADKRNEAKEAIRQQKMQAEIGKWVQDIRAKANVSLY